MNLDSLKWNYEPGESSSGRYKITEVFISPQTPIKRIVISICEDDDFGNHPWIETVRYYQDESGNKLDVIENKK